MTKEKPEKTKDQPKEKEEVKSTHPPEDDQGTEESQPMVGLTFNEYDAMEKEIEALRKDVENQTDQYLRVRADFENYKKRILRDSTRSYQDAMASILKIFLGAADDLERALKNRPATKELENWFNGIELIHQKLINQMKNQGVEQMEIKPGDTFDPNFHEAITQEDHEDFSDGQIIEVVQPGYRISDRIIRPAMVRVAK
ncbi:MAG: nucleotide exchange factor GrpE [Chloroflexota bacterium]|nr:nucleotide exchange factor GrpE [Chloroflexota bacterium]